MVDITSKHINVQMQIEKNLRQTLYALFQLQVPCLLSAQFSFSLSLSFHSVLFLPVSWKIQLSVFSFGENLTLSDCNVLAVLLTADSLLAKPLCTQQPMP